MLIILLNVWLSSHISKRIRKIQLFLKTCFIFMTGTDSLTCGRDYPLWPWKLLRIPKEELDKILGDVDAWIFFLDMLPL